jgi:hypothetical protein
LESINQTVRLSVNAFVLKQLTLRARAPGSPLIAALDDHAGSMAKASKKASASFPGIPKGLLAEAKTKLAAAKGEKAEGDREKTAAKAIEKTAKKTASRADALAAKETKEQAKRTAKAASKDEKAAKKAQKQAETAKEKEIGEDVRPSVHKLGRQGRTIIVLLDSMVEGPESSK